MLDWAKGSQRPADGNSSVLSLKIQLQNQPASFAFKSARSLPSRFELQNRRKQYFRAIVPPPSQGFKGRQ
jgi:hypothetical protein